MKNGLGYAKVLLLVFAMVCFALAWINLDNTVTWVSFIIMAVLFGGTWVWMSYSTEGRDN